FLSRSQKFLHGAIRLIDSHVSISGRAGIGVGNGDSSELLSADDIRALRFRPIRVEERVIFVSITVRPTVDRNPLNIFPGVNPSRAQDTRKLVSRFAFEIFKRG